MPKRRWTAALTSQGLRTARGYCEAARGRTTRRSAALRTATALHRITQVGRVASESGSFARFRQETHETQDLRLGAAFEYRETVSQQYAV